MKLFELFKGANSITLLTEWPNSRSWAILPATMELYGKRTVDIITAASTWSEETILVCENPEGRIVFLGSGGNYDNYVKMVGTSHETHHDQTGKSKGRYTVVNVVYIKNGKIEKQVNDIGIDKKASLAVFK